MSNRLLNAGICTFLGLTSSLIVGSDFVEEKYLSGAAKAGFIGTVATIIKSDKEQQAKLDKKYSTAIKGQEYLYEQFNDFKQVAQKNIEKLEISYQQQIDNLAQQLSALQAENAENKLDIRALSLLCNRKFKALRTELDQFKVDSDRDRQQIQLKMQSMGDKLNHRVAKIDAAIQQKGAEICDCSAKKKPTKSTIDKPQLVQKVTNLPSLRPPKTFILIDQANFYHACQKLGIEPDYRALMLQLMPEEGKFEMRIYLGVYDRPSKQQKTLIQELENLNYQVFTLPIDRRNDGTQKVVGDDVKLTSDLVEMVSTKEITSQDKIVLVTGDGDYFPALEKVKQRDIDTTLVARYPSRRLNGFVSCYLYLDLIKYDISKHQKLYVA